MLLYHGSYVKVDKPEIIEPNRLLDFGPGFYTTSNEKQAENFAAKVAKRMDQNSGVLNIYDFDDSSMGDLKTLRFDSANGEWLDFVSANRNGQSINDKYDLVIGPVADDDVYRTFILFSTGVLTRKQTIEVLKVKELFNQYVFVTNKALEKLTFNGEKAIEVI